MAVQKLSNKNLASCAVGIRLRITSNTGKRFRKICELRGLSAAGWDEDTFTITLDDEHYNNHVKDHKTDAEFLNKPLQYFEEMHTIFGSTMAIGMFAKDSSAPLGTLDGSTADCEDDDIGSKTTHDFNEGTSAASKSTKIDKINKGKKTNKRARTEYDPLVAAINRGSNKIAKAITAAGKSSDNDVSEDLFDNLMAVSEL